MNTDIGLDWTPPPGGYIWWYLDGISDDGVHALTIILFVGSVFSPYYRGRGWPNPEDHCAANIALYSPGRGRWAMTERGHDKLDRSARHYQLASTRLDLDDQGFTLTVKERAAPLPFPIEGTIRLDFNHVFEPTYILDSGGHHRWRPIAPLSTIHVDLSAPHLNWTGRAYMDSNWGEEPLEKAFSRWNWSRSDNGSSATLFYSPVEPNGFESHLALTYDTAGEIKPIDLPPVMDLKRAPIWQMHRAARCENRAPKILRTVEDTPFYSRSILEATLGGKQVEVMHESLDLKRLTNPIVQRMLPFRMPRGWWFG